MTEFSVLLRNMEAVNALHNAAEKRDYTIELHFNNHVIPATSLVGIFSFDLTKPIKVVSSKENYICD